MIESGYICQECTKPVVIIEGRIVRSCDHKESAVIATMTATATGEGKAEQG